MRRTLILLLLALALGASVGRAQSVVLVPSRNDDGALCLARVTLDATDAVEAIDTFELPLILGRPPSGIVVHSSGRVLLERRENTVANPNDALDWVT
ncbi:MAG: hypothetical protein KF858_16645, partial [Candidatus Sumerlaeia bacterium]|nr:hypothetical protein [Candidatus Sumerlaeia bacterium]